MANLSKVIYINEVDYSTLLNGGTITKGGVTYSHDPTALYVIKNVSAPEYAETAGYATTAGQATKATQDGNGDVISETYAKKIIIGELDYPNDEEGWGCDKTYSQLASAMLAGDIVLLKQGNAVYYPTSYPYLNGDNEVTGVLRFRYIGSGGYSETFLIYTDNTIGYEENDLESDIYEQGINHQRTVLKLTIGQNNTLTFTDQNNDTVSTSQAYYSIINGMNDQDVVIRYNNLEYRKQTYESDNSCITFVSIDLEDYLLFYLSFDCSTSNTVTLIENTSIPILSENVDFGQAYGISSNNVSSAARTSSIPGFKLKEGGIVAIKFTTDVDITGPSLNISSTGAKSIYYRESAPPRGTINAGDTVTFIYDGTHYHIISIDKNIPDPATTAPIMDGTATIGTSDKYAKADHVHPSDTSRVPTSRKINNNPLSSDITLTASDVGALPSSTVIPDELADLSDDSTHRLVTDAEKSTWNGKQDTLVSGTNIKTIDGESLLGLGNIDTTFIVEVTYDTNTDTYRATESPTSIRAAWENGKNVILTVDGYAFPLYYVDVNYAYFSSLIGDINAYYTVSINSNNTASLSTNSIPSLANNLTTTDSGQALDATQGRILKNMITAQQVRVGSVAGKLYRNNVGGSGNFSISGNSGCIPNLVAGTYQVAIYAKSSTQAYIFRFNFGSSVTYDLTATKGIINDFREITIPSNGTFSGSVLNSSVASGTILYVVMYDYVTPVSTVGVAAVTNRYSDLDGTPTIPTVPTNISSFTNNVGYVTSTAITDLTDIL